MNLVPSDVCWSAIYRRVLLQVLLAFENHINEIEIKQRPLSIPLMNSFLDIVFVEYK